MFPLLASLAVCAELALIPTLRGPETRAEREPISP